MRTFNPANDTAPLTHTHTRLVNVAVVERKRMPYSESGNRGSVFDDAEVSFLNKFLKKNTVFEGSLRLKISRNCKLSDKIVRCPKYEEKI